MAGILGEERPDTGPGYLAEAVFSLDFMTGGSAVTVVTGDS